MYFPVVRKVLRHLFEHARGLEPKHVCERALQSLLKIFFGFLLVPRLVGKESEPHFHSCVGGFAICVFEELDCVGVETVVHVFNSELKVRFRVVAHELFKFLPARQQLFFAGGVCVYWIKCEHFFRAFERALFIALSAQYGGL